MNSAILKWGRVGAKSASAEQGQRLGRIGVRVVLGAVLPVAVWMALAELSMAVVAPAFVKVDLNRRPIQHLEGGIIRSVLVRDGQQVKAGEPVLVLGDVGVDADRNRLAYRVMVERAGLARLESEQIRSRTLQFPDDLVQAAQHDERVRQALAKEITLFEARRDSLESEAGLMKLQRTRVDDEAVALRAQIEQVANSLHLQKKDLEVNRGLLRENFISAAKISQLEATVADYASKLEERRSELARVGQRRGDIDLRIKSLQNAYVQNASDQVKVSVARLSEIEQEVRKTEDAATRQVVVAPASGEIMDLKFTSPGAVLRPGDSIAEIVPTDARLMLEARIKPEEINHIHLDQKARIKFTAFKYRSTAMVEGRVTYVSGDRFVDRATNQPYFSVTILADAGSLLAAGDMKLLAGMPAEVYIEGSKQTPLQYIMEPITSTLRKASREL
jgi:epimerase transport system membrane fusion protein